MTRLEAHLCTVGVFLAIALFICGTAYSPEGMLVLLFAVVCASTLTLAYRSLYRGFRGTKP